MHSTQALALQAGSPVAAPEPASRWRTDEADFIAHDVRFATGETLGEWAERIAAWSRELKAVYVYFDNDDSGYAPRNALELKEQVSRRMEGLESSQRKSA